MNAPRHGARTPAAQARRSWLGSAAALGALVLAGTSDAEQRSASEPCPIASVAAAGVTPAGVAIEVLTGSRLLEAPDERLELVAGRALGCDDPTTRRVLGAIEVALHELPGARPAAPLRVHLDPRLPSRQAPLSGIEVHVSRRELLVARAALDELEPEAWRHELLHLLAAAPPQAPIERRRLWLTVEEGVVAHLARSATRPPPVAAGARPSEPDAAGAALATARAIAAPPAALPREEAASDSGSRRLDPPRPLPQRALPLQALLASSAYDPHPLAAGLARELEREAAVPLDAWLGCLATPAPALAADAALYDVSRAFAVRCAEGPSSALTAAIDRWWGLEPSPSSAATAGFGAVSD